MIENLEEQNTIEASGLVVSLVSTFTIRQWLRRFSAADGVTSNLHESLLMDTFLSWCPRPTISELLINTLSTSLGAELSFFKSARVSIEDLTGLADRDIQLGAIGIHQQPEYTTGVTEEEMMAHGVVAAKYGVPLCLHLRSGETTDPSKQEDAVAEAIAVAEETGCRVHIEHLNSTGGTGRMAEAIEQINDARSRGSLITACTYPYTSWATYAATSRFNNFEEKFGITYEDLQVLGTSTRETAAEWPSIRLLILPVAMSEEDITTALKAPWMMIGSDSILEQRHNNHPRCSGTSAVLGRYVRERDAHPC